MVVSRLTVMIIAAFIWYSGGVALVLKASSLVKSAYLINPCSIWVLLAPLLGIVAGLIKAKFIFIHSSTKNIKRIKSLPSPRIWQCFRPGMLIFLAIIIPTGAWMSRAAAGNFTGLCFVAALDFSIACGLLLSSAKFWDLKAFSNTHLTQ